jgi:hypothetical protein
LVRHDPAAGKRYIRLRVYRVDSVKYISQIRTICYPFPNLPA